MQVIEFPAQNFIDMMNAVVENASEQPQRLQTGLGGADLPPPVFKAFTPRLIGLAGKARSGKDTAAGMLQTAFKAKTLAFAAPLKDGLKTMLDLTDEHVHGSLKETVIADYGKSPREMLQTLGTDWGREMVHTDIWLTAARRRFEAWLEAGDHVVITDVRFNNEAEMIRELGGTVWHIKRDNATTVAAHKSEGGVQELPGDIVIYNNGTLDDLFDEVCDNF